MMYRFIVILISLVLFSNIASTQSNSDALFIKEIYSHSLKGAPIHNWLNELCKDVGPRLSGSEGAAESVNFCTSKLSLLGVDEIVELPCQVPHWIRGGKEMVSTSLNGKEFQFRAASLGNSVSTGGKIFEAEVIEVFGLDTLEILADKIKGKIVFFNRPFDDTQINTGYGYGKAVDQRVYGPTRAAKYGAIGALVRSVTNAIDTFPHTGVTVYDSIYKIPAIAISTVDANILSEAIRTTPGQTVKMYNECENLGLTPSHSVIGEIKGSEFPDEIILVGGHLDSWDIGEGAHDDGVGCVHALQVIETFKALDYTPKRTIRCVLFMNEENGLAGGRSYAKWSNDKNEFHIAAIESDSGGFTPRGFTCTADESVFVDYLKNLKGLFGPLEAYDLFVKKGGGGADISPLKSQKGLLIGFKPDSQRYFDYHHTSEDIFENVNKRELELGAAAISSLVYLIDQYGI